MSYLWNFQSFSEKKFSEIFGGGSPSVRNALIEVVTWDEDMWKPEELELALSLVDQIVANGISYVGLNSQQSLVLDTIVSTVFSPEGLVDELEIEFESPDGVHPSVVQELLTRSGEQSDTLLLPVLLRGRRFAQNDLSVECNYCILRPEEMIEIEIEIGSALDASGEWSAEYIPELVTECLLDVMTSIRKKGKAAAGLLG